MQIISEDRMFSSYYTMLHLFSTYICLLFLCFRIYDCVKCVKSVDSSFRSVWYIRLLAELDLLKDVSRSDEEDSQSLDDISYTSFDQVS